MAVSAPLIYEGTRIPSPVPTMIEVPEELRRSADILEVNFGPNHPSTHGVLRLVVQLDGETVVGLRAIIGYLHTGFEKSMEQKTWWKAIPYAPRMDYLAFQANELAFVLAIEKLLGIEVPPKAIWMRTLLCELNRIHSHLVWLGTSALELGAISPFWYAFRERDRVLDLFELVTGARMHTRYFQVGGLADDIPRGFFPQCREFCEVMPKAVDQYESMLSENPIWQARTKGVGLLSADDAIALGQSGPVLRASGVDWDLRKAAPYLAYGDVDFDVPVKENGDVYDRYKVHMDEMRESVRIVEQTLEGMPPGPWIADDRKVVLPPREELHTSMESLIHHFKLVTEGFTVPEGEVYVAVESPRGELGCYVCSDGGPRPWRVRFRAPSFVALQATATCMGQSLVADMVAVVGSLDTVMGEVDRVSAGERDPGRRGALPRPPLGDAAGAAHGAGALRLAVARGARRGRGRARLHAGLLPVRRVLLRHVPSRAHRRARGGGLHEPLVRPRRRAGGRSRLRVRARRQRRRDDGGRPGDAPRRRVPRRLRLRARDHRRPPPPPSREAGGRARHRRGAPCRFLIPCSRAPTSAT